MDKFGFTSLIVKIIFRSDFKQLFNFLYAFEGSILHKEYDKASKSKIKRKEISNFFKKAFLSFFYLNP